jgi:8-oxo-dGTP pyrophosphatase MutT (NUDIX family)
MSERPRAAVVIAIAASPPHGVVFIERAAHLRNHPGQIGLPGGRVDEDDAHPEAAALRELHEEIGVPPGRVRLVGVLPDVPQGVGPFIVTPFVGIIAPETPFTIDPSETAALFTVPLARIVEPEAVRNGTVHFDDRIVETLVFEHEDRIVWGLTGRILRVFVDAWHDVGNGLRSRVETALMSPGH